VIIIIIVYLNTLGQFGLKPDFSNFGLSGKLVLHGLRPKTKV